FLAVPSARAEYKAWVLATFEDTPEGLAVDPAGNIYAALMHVGKIMKVTPGGKQELLAIVPSAQDVGKGEVVGIDLDKAGNIYVAYKQNSPKYEATNLRDPFHAACRDATVTLSGVYKIDATTRRVTALATRRDGWPFCFPDDVAIDSQGNVYLTDLTYSGIWKLSPDGKKVERWSSHPLLNWSATPYSGLPLGVNVLVLDKDERNVYAATNGDPMIVRIPINPDGSAGEPTVISRGHSPFDGIEFDERGNIYVSEILRNELWVLSPDGSQRMLVADRRTAPLDNNTSIIWHDGVICTANLGFTHFPRIEEAARTIVCISGFQRP
ncbi:MAG: SMP-30/gluconolactonase/LRE family protein, partial [Acidobacteriota bacterium]